MTIVSDLPDAVTTNTVATDLGVSYGRISDDDTLMAEGVESQAMETDELAERRRIPLAARFIDNSLSASKDLEKRDDYRAMLARISRGDVRYVLAWHPDRLHRNVGEGARFIELCRKHGVTVVTVTAGDFDLSTAYGRKAFVDATNNAAYESEHRGERVSMARKRQARTGRWGGGVRPYGWGAPTNKVRSATIDTATGKKATRDTPPERRETVDVPVLDVTRHNPREAEVIRWMKDEILSGTKMNVLIGELKRRGIPTASETDNRVIRKGGKAARDSRGWNSRSIRQILVNPRVAGHATREGKIVQEGAWEPIITEDERQALIAVLDDPSRKTSPGPSPKWLASLIATCGWCDDGTTMAVRYGSKGPVYRCRTGGHNSIDAPELDRYLTAAVLAVIDRDAADLIETPDSGLDVNALRDERRTLIAKRNRLVDMWNDDKIDDEQLERGTAKINKRVGEIDAELAEAAQTSPVADLVGVEDLTAAWEAKTLGQRREILRTVLSVTILPGPVHQIDSARVKYGRAK